MSEEKKKLGVEDLVKAQQETAEQLKIIAERLDWICDAEHQPYNYGCGWIWWSVMIVGLLTSGASIAQQRAEPLLALIAVCTIVLVGINLRDSSKTPRQQRAERWADEKLREKEERYFEERQRLLEERAAKKAQEKKERIITSKPKIDLKKDS